MHHTASRQVGLRSPDLTSTTMSSVVRLMLEMLECSKEKRQTMVVVLVAVVVVIWFGLVSRKP